MKELSIEQKAQRYGEALKKAKDFYKGYKQRDNQLYADDLESIFPELKESEDECVEKIKKDIISYLNNRQITSIAESSATEKWIAWLEKQGERPINKVEPKFKDGDWIVYKDTVWKVCNISLLNYYELLKINNEVSTRLIEDVDNNAHLWTIQDAKDGDVLVVEPIESYYLPFIAIYKERGFDFFNSHCFIGFDGIFYNGDTGHSIDNIHPATKEQRDTLERAMADAGYTFDFDKKELKKIQQTSAWSEEDERMKDQLVDFMLSGIDISKAPYGCVAWLKSIKDRYTWKPSEEQLKSLQEVIDVGHFTSYPNALETLYEQLKQL